MTSPAPPPDAPVGQPPPAGPQQPPPLSYYGKTPPPPPSYAPVAGGYAPTRPPKKGIPNGVLALIIIGVVLVAIVAIGQAVGGGSSSTGSADVTVSECTANRFTGPEATLSVTNSSSSSRDYIIKVEFLDGSTRLGSRTVSVNDLAPGQTEQPRAVAFRPTTSTTFSCSVTSVTRF